MMMGQMCIFLSESGMGGHAGTPFCDDGTNVYLPI